MVRSFPSPRVLVRVCVCVCACVRACLDCPVSSTLRAEVKEGTPRTLLLVSKMVNNLMNEVAFGDKEPFMLPLNSFLNHQNKEAVQRFVQNLTVRFLFIISLFFILFLYYFYYYFYYY